jgi:hypothetical protein
MPPTSVDPILTSSLDHHPQPLNSLICKPRPHLATSDLWSRISHYIKCWCPGTLIYNNDCPTRRYYTTEYNSKASPWGFEHEPTSQAGRPHYIVQYVRLGRISIHLRPYLDPVALLLPLCPLRSSSPMLRRQSHQADLGQERRLQILSRCRAEA